MKTPTKNSKLLSIAAVALMTVAGCSSTPKNNATLDAAHANYRTAQGDPSVQKYAAVELKDANDALGRADEALTKHDKPAVVDHLAYLAQQKVAIALSQAELKTAEDNIKNSTAQRDQAVLQARTMEADRLRAELNAKQTERGMTISLGDVLFDTNKAQLKPGGRREVQKLSQFLRDHPQRNISIEGFTDNRGSEEHNQALSERRAEAVKDELISEGVSPERISSHGYGEEYPVADNKTSAGRQMNRRVEIVVADEGKQIAPR